MHSLANNADEGEAFRLLAVDDDEVNLTLLGHWVRRENIELLTTTSGEEGLRLLREERPDVLLLDAIMPGMDGFDVLRARMQEPDLLEIPAILWSAQDSEDAIAKGLDLGAFDYAPKGNNIAVTLARLRAAARFKRHQDSLRTAQRRAEAASEAKTAFLANMSHEIRTPLTAILGFAALGREPDLNDAQRIDYASLIHSNAEHLLTILNDILDLSKVEAGKMVVESIPVSPFEVVQQVSALHEAAALEKGLVYEVEFFDHIPEVFVSDPTRLRQILLNLVSNGIKFTDQGRVKIRVSTRPPDDGRDPQIRFEVIDSGCGLSPEHQERLFERFSQADSSTTRTHGGTGLGLVLCRHLAHLLRGDITVESAVGRGTTFALNLPVTGCTRLVTAEEMDLDRRHRAREAIVEVALAGRVLLAEDTPDSRLLAATILTKMGVEVTAVENGREAQDLALAEAAGGRAFDLLLLDLHMPVMDGLTATENLRNAGYSQPIAALSAAVFAEERSACDAAGFDAFAAKPIRRAELRSILERFVRVSGSA